ncbi:hypothetical protein D3C73_1568000 [compost metagenome]
MAVKPSQKMSTLSRSIIPGQTGTMKLAPLGTLSGSSMPPTAAGTCGTLSVTGSPLTGSRVVLDKSLVLTV